MSKDRVQLFKASRFLNAATDTILHAAKESGHTISDRLAAGDPNARMSKALFVDVCKIIAPDVDPQALFDKDSERRAKSRREKEARRQEETERLKIAVERAAMKAAKEAEAEALVDEKLARRAADFSPEYRHSLETSLADFVQAGDSAACIGYYCLRYGDCEMCGYRGIKWHYILENLRSGQSMIVGSECIKNYQIVLSEWGFKPDHVTFPETLRSYASWILEDNPRAVVFDSGIVMSARTDAGPLIKSRADLPGRDLEHYKYVRSIERGNERCLDVVNGG